jgi:hypothetical protein
MNLRVILNWVGLAALAAAIGAAPATQPANAPDTHEITPRQQNLLMQLSDAEANIQAINKALKLTGYKVGHAYDRIDSAQKGNELMDRKGGGPVRWDEFYGTTARDFYAPSSWATYHREGNGRSVDLKVAEGYGRLVRPPQFDYIYKANTDQASRAKAQVDALAKDQATLLDRRQKHETDQSRLWAMLAWDRVKDQEIALRPIYRFQLKPAGAESAMIRPVVLFLRTADAASTDALQTLKDDQGASFAKVDKRMQDSYAALQIALADALLAPGVTSARRAQAESLKAICKGIAEDCDVIVDDYTHALDSDKAKEDNSKLQFRGELQSSLAYFAAAVAELDHQISKTADGWSLTGEVGVANPDTIKSTPAVEAPVVKTNHITPEELLARFTFPNKTFRVDGDAITGTAGDCNDPATFAWLAHAENAESFEFGFSIKARWYHIAAVEIDGQRYAYSRGHWANRNSGVFAYNAKPERRIAGTVKGPDEWTSMRVVVEHDRITYFYNGETVASSDLVKPATKSSTVKVGFSSNQTEVSVKDFYFSVTSDQKAFDAPVPNPRHASNDVQKMDLLALADPARDAVHGKWVKTETGLQSDGTHDAALQFRYHPPAQYDLTVTFTPLAQKDCVNVVAVMNAQQFQLNMASANAWGGLDQVANRRAFDEGNPTKTRVSFTAGHQYALVLHVRKDRVSASLDGKPLVDYKTDGHDLSLTKKWKLRDADTIGIQSGDTPTVFHSVELTPIE